jgi:hypothetical protein
LPVELPGLESKMEFQAESRRGKTMKLMTMWSVKDGAIHEAVQKFLETGAQPQPGVTLLGRWHRADLSGGYSLYETDDPAALYMGAAIWAELMDLETTVVVEDAVAGPALKKVFG